MADRKSKKLEQRRAQLSESRPALSRKRDHTYRMNSDAQALDRAGITHHAPPEMARLGEEQADADAAIQAAQREIRDLDAEIGSASGGSLGARIVRALRRA